MNFTKYILWCALVGTLLTPFLSTAQEAPKAKGDTLTLWVDGACGMCAKRIKNAAMRTPGLKSANWDMTTKVLTVTFDGSPFDENQLHQNVAGVGHDTEKVKAETEVYDKLHSCCKYRDLEEEDDDDGDGEGEGHHPHDGQQNGRALAPDPSTVQGQVFEYATGGKRLPLIGANVVWLGTAEGTATDLEGRFELPRHPGNDRLIITYIGYGSDTVAVEAGYDVEVTLSNAALLAAVEVTHRRRATEVSLLAPLQVQMIGEKELMKAACCNLSESFDTTPSVDVSFTDAVTGTRQIQMLGLASPYIQITRENMPDVRGLSALYGMAATAGPWVESMQLSMGAGSVANGFEAIAGQINVELRKPEDSDRLYLNLYGSDMGRFEANANVSHRLNDRWSTGTLLHAKTQMMHHDPNGDGFLDAPLSQAAVGIHRWSYQDQKGLAAQMGVKGTWMDDRSGQMGFFSHDGKDHTGHLWGARVQTRRTEGWAKIGKVFADRPNTSVGLQLSALHHQQRAFFGLRRFDAEQRAAYANLIYQGIMGTTDHNFRTGASFQWDRFDETVAGTPYLRNEWVPGAFFEYTYKGTERLTVVAGLRADYHNQFGLFATPRLHLSYQATERTTLRGSVGRGQRTASIFAENIGLLASARQIVVHGDDPAASPYGLDAEVAWNYGLNLTHSFEVATRPATFIAGVYHARFVNQIVVDFDQNPQQVHFYNLQGRSHANSAMAQVDMEVLPRFDVRMAYRFNDVRISFADGILEKPLLSRHRAFLNLAYEAPHHWHFDFTLNWQGSKRIPNTTPNPAEYQLPTRSPHFTVLNAQVAKRWGQWLEIYVGAENLLGFTQAQPILAADDPFGPFFDGSLVWGPIFGRNIYAGLRYRIAYKEKG